MIENATPLLLLAAAVAGLGLLITLGFEIVQIFPKVAGAVLGKNSLGANSALRLLIFNRVGAAMFFPSFGYLVDRGIEFATLALISAFAIMCFSLFSLSLNLYFETYLRFFSKLFFRRESGESLHISSLVKDPSAPMRDRTSAFWFSALAGFFGCVGLTLPMLLGSLFPDYRLTLANTGFVFNSVFSVLTIFVIDRRLSEYCDSRSERLIEFSRATIRGRVGGTLVLAIAYFSLALF
ncbi:MAG: hypothetical protein AAFN07_02040 [Pseudomonadota bacterium]